VAEIVRAGCDWLVSGASIFKSADPAATVAEMRSMAQNATAARV
jgi:pentose-5-phosphate-3-epimerase